MKNQRQFLSVAAIFAAFAVLAACAINPATGKRQLVLMGEAQEIQLGLENDQQVVASLGLYDDDELQRYVLGLGKTLAATSERPNLDWSFRVVDDPVVNAFALPGGFIYVTRGILAHLNSEAELASVLGHEIGHVTARHGVNQMSKQQLASLGFGASMILAPELQQYAGHLQAAMGLLFLKYSRDDERQADDLGLRYLDRAEYDVRPMPNVFAMLKAYGDDQGGGRAPAWQATHPAPERRHQRIAAMIAATGVDYSGRPVNRDAFLDRIDGMMFGPNPREGYFKETAFFHPEMKFRLDFPRDWQTQNQKQAVVAMSPDQTAAIQMTLAAKPATEALAEFLAQQGVQAGPAGKTHVNGLPAASRGFLVQTEQGMLQGWVSFIEHQGAVFQLVGFTPQANWPQNGPAIANTLDSFARLTDPAALNAEAKRLRIVTAGSGMNLADLARRHRASIPIEDLALVNGLEVTDRLSSGMRYKVVTGSGLP